MFNTHINVEISAKIKNIKYLFKYMYKGNDQATIKIIRLIDEIKQYLNARYLNIIEAIDFLLPFCTHFEKRLVKCLVVYLQSPYNVVINTIEDLL